ncbi:hypothetical protein RCL1_003659 [Eukaryota sp. TZLM3-RCL]
MFTPSTPMAFEAFSLTQSSPPILNQHSGFVENMMRDILRAVKKSPYDTIETLKKEDPEFFVQIGTRFFNLLHQGNENHHHNFNHLLEIARVLDKFDFRLSFREIACVFTNSHSFDTDHLQRLSSEFKELLLLHHDPPAAQQDDTIRLMLRNAVEAAICYVLYFHITDIFTSRIFEGCPRMFPSNQMLHNSRSFVSNQQMKEFVSHSLQLKVEIFNRICLRLAKTIPYDVCLAIDLFEQPRDWVFKVLFNSITSAQVEHDGNNDGNFYSNEPQMLTYETLLDTFLVEIAMDLKLPVPLTDLELFDASGFEFFVVQIWKPKILKPLVDRPASYFQLRIEHLEDVMGCNLLQLLYSQEELSILSHFISFISSFERIEVLIAFADILNRCFAAKTVFNVFELIPLMFCNSLHVSKLLIVCSTWLCQGNSLELSLNHFFLSCRTQFLEHLFASSISADMAFWICSSRDFQCSTKWLVDSCWKIVYDYVMNISIPVKITCIEGQRIVYMTGFEFSSPKFDSRYELFPRPSLKKFLDQIFNDQGKVPSYSVSS